jgi:Lrp/AsnC family transcriptional regulator
MGELDDIDRRILTQLQREADLPLEELGARVGLSRNACWRRIKAMEAAGIITGRVALVDAGKLGLGLTVFISIKAARHDAEWLKTFAQVTRAMPEVQGVYRMTGELDYLIRARVADMAGYDRLYQALISKVPLGDVSASFVMEHIKETTALPV